MVSFKTRFGYHIIKVTDKRPAEYKQLPDVRENIRAKLLDKAKQQEFMDFVELLKGRAKVEIKEEVFKQKPVEEGAPVEKPTK